MGLKIFYLKFDPNFNSQAKPMIPKVFHHIWVSDDNSPLPAKFEKYRQTWIKHHPGWEFRVWNLSNIDFEPSRKDLLGSATSYAQVADILRYEILYRQGGVYVDVDFECCRPIDNLLQGVDNFACSENGEAISIGIIGAVKGSNYMKMCVENLPKKVGVTYTSNETGPSYFRKVLLENGIFQDFVLFPSKWFYPYSFNELARENEKFPEAVAIHRWAGSWIDNESRFLSRVKRKINSALDRISALELKK